MEEHWPEVEPELNPCDYIPTFSLKSSCRVSMIYILEGLLMNEGLMVALTDVAQRFIPCALLFRLEAIISPSASGGIDAAFDHCIDSDCRWLYSFHLQAEHLQI